MFTCRICKYWISSSVFLKKRKSQTVSGPEPCARKKKLAFPVSPLHSPRGIWALMQETWDCFPSIMQYHGLVWALLLPFEPCSFTEKDSQHFFLSVVRSTSGSPHIFLGLPKRKPSKGLKRESTASLTFCIINTTRKTAKKPELWVSNWTKSKRAYIISNFKETALSSTANRTRA